MEVVAKQNMREEIIVDGCPIGNVLLDENGKVQWAEIYNDYVHTKFEAKMLKMFADKINEKYEWVEEK